jgi:murein DD-endopeptidase MepM/ murein hydrolase activator NlpD
VLLAVPLVVLVAAFAYLAWRQTRPGVRADWTPAPQFIGVRTPLALTLRAAHGGVQAVEVRLVQGQGRAVLAQQAFPGDAPAQRLELAVAGRDTGLREGAATLEVRARDSFWRPVRVDDRPILAHPVTLDFTPPSLEVLSATRYLHQGGGGLVALRARGAARVHVKVGDLAFPSFAAGPPDSGLAVAMFALPWDVPTTAPITAVAQDEAGNAATRPVPGEFRPRRFPTDVIELSERFLVNKLPELLPDRGAIPPDKLVEAFLVVNRDQRKAAEQMKRQLGTRTEPLPLWEGAFVQPRNTKVFSNFAETRSYRYQGREVDVQVHPGYDLASLQHSPVPAANAGRVVHAAPLSIYGNTVVVDHGLGLMTLYGHLSSFAVKEGDAVTRGQELGRSGTTGLAVGDHIHFEVLIHGISVTPVEWWDGKWIRDRIGLPLKEANIALLQSEQPASPAAADPAAEPPARTLRPRRR